MSSHFGDRDYDEASRRQARGRRGREVRRRGYRARRGEWQGVEPIRRDYGWKGDEEDDADRHDVYAREDTISFRGTRTPYYGWPTYQAGPHTGKGPKGYRRSDERIYEDACDRLCNYGWLDASDIEVSVENGEVTLQGTVQERRAKRMAEDLVAEVSGVWDVHNRLRLSREGRQTNAAENS